jgi:hypothetical protein
MHGKTRRQMLRDAACGFGYVALAGLLSGNSRARAGVANPLAAKQPHFAPRAKRVIFLFMQGGPSHVDTFDPKERLRRDNGQEFTFRNDRTRRDEKFKLMQSPWGFRQYGQCGTWVSDLFPHVARHVDDLCVIKSTVTEGVAHGPSTLFLHTGAINLVRPSVGAWVTYGLGTENENLPGFVTISPSSANGGPRNYSGAFLPTIYQGTTIGRAGMPITQGGIRHITNDRIALGEQRRELDFLQALNREQMRRTNPSPPTPLPDGERGANVDDELEAAIGSFELAYRMQMSVPGLLDISQESKPTLDLYGIGEKETDDFGRQCLLARRMAEAGVRYMQVNYADNTANPRWDQHSNIKLHEVHARAVDKPIAGLLQDLKSRGLLDDTLVWWSGEFGRTPFAQGSDGRDHNINGFSCWLAGGGIRAALSYGSTDEFGYYAIENKVHMHDLHATILHLLGLDHERLTYRYAGRDFRLTDVAGNVVQDIMA